MKRSELKRGTSTLKRTGSLKPRSAKTAAKYAGSDGVEGRRAFVERILTERPECEARHLLLCCHPDDERTLDQAGRCTRHSVDVHEILARSAGGSILDDKNVLAVCRSCHDWIGNHPKKATALGLRRSRYPGRNGVFNEANGVFGEEITAAEYFRRPSPDEDVIDKAAILDRLLK